MTVLILDTETIEHPGVPAKPCDDKDRVPAAPHLQIAAACSIVLERRTEEPIEQPGERVAWYEATHAICFGTTEVPSERQIVERLAKAIEKRPKLVGYNSGGFDLRVIVAALMDHGIQCPWLMTKDVNYRFSTEHHEDVMESLSNFGRGRAGGQDAWARRIGLPGKMGVDGSQVKDLYAAGKYQEIKDYCMQDVGQLSGIWLRKEFVAGGLCRTGYRASALSLLALFERTLALRPIVEDERFDRARFLLEAAC